MTQLCTKCKKYKEPSLIHLLFKRSPSSCTQSLIPKNFGIFTRCNEFSPIKEDKYKYDGRLETFTDNEETEDEDNGED